MSRFVSIIVVCLAVPAVAKPWNGIEPGVSTAADVAFKFGNPSKKVPGKESEIWVFAKATAIQGTVQAQFRFDAVKNVVQRIDVYPEPILKVADIEKAYGPVCTTASTAGCYVRKETPKKAPYFVYASLGLAIFFKADGLTVLSFVFLPNAAVAPVP